MALNFNILQRNTLRLCLWSHNQDKLSTNTLTWHEAHAHSKRNWPINPDGAIFSCTPGCCTCCSSIFSPVCVCLATIIFPCRTLYIIYIMRREHRLRGVRYQRIWCGGEEAAARMEPCVARAAGTQCLHYWSNKTPSWRLCKQKYTPPTAERGKTVQNIYSPASLGGAHARRHWCGTCARRGYIG